jgi:hypothetical protein
MPSGIQMFVTQVLPGASGSERLAPAPSTPNVCLIIWTRANTKSMRYALALQYSNVETAPIDKVGGAALRDLADHWEYSDVIST